MYRFKFFSTLLSLLCLTLVLGPGEARAYEPEATPAPHVGIDLAGWDLGGSLGFYADDGSYDCSCIFL